MRGFTLIEMVVVLAILLILFAIVGTIASGTLPKNQLNHEGGFVQETLRRAQALSVAGKQDTVWSVHFTSSTMTLFAGTDYATRDPQYDELHTFPDGLTASGLTDVTFTAPKGTPSTTGSVTLTNDATTQSVTITINAAGRISR